MTIIENLEKNIKNLEKYVDVKQDKLGEVFKFFYDDMLAFDMSVFAKTEQVRIFEKAFERDIKYITYVSIFNRLCKESNTKEIFTNNDKLDMESESKNTEILVSRNKTKNVSISEDKKMLDESQKKDDTFMKKLVNQGNKNIKIKKEI